MTDTVGVAIVTAGPGLTNTITAVKNAQMAKKPLLIIGGATTDLLKGKGSLQDIDQQALFDPHVKWQAHVNTVREIIPTMERAFYEAQSGVPGPVFVEIPFDFLYCKKTLVKEMENQKPKGTSWAAAITRWYIDRHIARVFSGMEKDFCFHAPRKPSIPTFSKSQLQTALQKIKGAKKPVLIVGSQSLLSAEKAEELRRAVDNSLSGMARGLLGTSSELQMRHKRTLALRETDVCILAGVPLDFRLGYGFTINSKGFLISVNRDKVDLYKNRTPSLPVLADPADFLIELGKFVPQDKRSQWEDWHTILKTRNDARDKQILGLTSQKVPGVNPLKLCHRLENLLGPNALLVADGGDFVATASYIVKPRAPLRWLDPGPFGTLGVGMGFAIGAKMAKPETEVWIIFGDGACGMSLIELDTARRHNIPVILLIGNDACWSQIHRDQVVILKDDVGCMLEFTDYHKIAEGLGAAGLYLDKEEDIDRVIKEAREIYKTGKSVVINAKIGRT
eukprot:CAMPEP_0168539694 /NCGR_PEP_ID=MMETSP0405-20121227/21990_1 /TAXON_ID=498012 /ORGANISM="Trichosphaerium sp, Strain Am-I-7 wt" /LENGTH=505 /DNA_ID=CAMNT_0008569325 /DNA_START=101 /DNA_END=1613 /DNA_ORIENTATION=-